MLDRILVKLLEWILGRTIKKYGIDAFEDALLKTGFTLELETLGSKIYANADGAYVTIEDTNPF